MLYLKLLLLVWFLIKSIDILTQPKDKIDFNPFCFRNHTLVSMPNGVNMSCMLILCACTIWTVFTVLIPYMTSSPRWQTVVSVFS